MKEKTSSIEHLWAKGKAKGTKNVVHNLRGTENRASIRTVNRKSGHALGSVSCHGVIMQCSLCTRCNNAVFPL